MAQFSCILYNNNDNNNNLFIYLFIWVGVIPLKWWWKAFVILIAKFQKRKIYESLEERKKIDPDHTFIHFFAQMY
jgi:hypothetical protein